MREKNWQILARNVRIAHGEIDIVARHDGSLVIVEVKGRMIGKILPAEYAVGPKQLKSLVKHARIYIDRQGYMGFWRIDLIAMDFVKDIKDSNNNLKILHLEHLQDITYGRI